MKFRKKMFGGGWWIQWMPSSREPNSARKNPADSPHKNGSSGFHPLDEKSFRTVHFFFDAPIQWMKSRSEQPKKQKIRWMPKSGPIQWIPDFPNGP
jgi:hypothetical protein